MCICMYVESKKLNHEMRNNRQTTIQTEYTKISTSRCGQTEIILFDSTERFTHFYGCHLSVCQFARQWKAFFYK